MISPTARCVAVMMFVAATSVGVAAEKSPQQREADRSFPSVFQAWGRVEHTGSHARLADMARHDLAWIGVGQAGLHWTGRWRGQSQALDPKTLDAGRAMRRKLMKLNPNMVLLAEVRYRDAPRDFLPADSEYWMRDAAGKPIVGWAEGGYDRLDVHNAAFRHHVAMQCKAVMDSGVFDGVMLDWWRDDDDHVALVQEIRKAIGERAMIIGNVNDHQTPRTSPYLNGVFMECWRTKTAKDWRRIGDTLRFDAEHLREPRLCCVEFWYHHSRADRNLMRAVTALSMTYADGYALFSDPDELPTPDHLHDWYKFWDVKLGRPTEAAHIADDGFATRRFDHGVAAYNPMGNKPHEITFDKPHRSAATGAIGKTFKLDAADGDMYVGE